MQTRRKSFFVAFKRVWWMWSCKCEESFCLDVNTSKNPPCAINRRLSVQNIGFPAVSRRFFFSVRINIGILPNPCVISLGYCERVRLVKSSSCNCVLYETRYAFFPIKLVASFTINHNRVNSQNTYKLCVIFVLYYEREWLVIESSCNRVLAETSYVCLLKIWLLTSL